LSTNKQHSLLERDRARERERERLLGTPVLDVPPFAQGPDNIAVFATIYEIICKLTHMLLVGLFYGTQEE
jgi:hypothetical protein